MKAIWQKRNSHGRREDGQQENSSISTDRKARYQLAEVGKFIALVALSAQAIFVFSFLSAVTPQEEREEVPRFNEPGESPIANADTGNQRKSIVDVDADCPFRNSNLYRSIYVYEQPDVGPPSMRYNASYQEKFPEWPWEAINEETKQNRTGHYALGSNMGQFALEIIVNDIFMHPKSCLRTMDPESATLFYVPFLNSVHFHKGRLFPKDYSTTPYAQAFLDATDGNYGTWGKVWGLTDKYWKRKNGADHVTVASEPLHGYSHPRNRRGNFHFLHSQKQLSPPIVISVELSTTFVDMYPKCAQKNIVVPYSNPDGRWYNGAFDKKAIEILNEKSMSEIATGERGGGKLARVYYSAGKHGSCQGMRKALAKDHSCSSSMDEFQGKLQRTKGFDYSLGMRMATFCPCPGGDSPSAKRMYDAVLSGCIPVILSHDFVWGLSTEGDPDSRETMLDPSSFSIRLDSTSFLEPQTFDGNCTVKPGGKPLQAVLEEVSAQEVRRLQKGLQRAQTHYSFYSFRNESPDEVMREGVLPDGGAAHALVAALEARAGGARWPACEAELKSLPPNLKQPNRFKC